MKVVVTVTVEIEDPSQWTLAFGVEGLAAIRQDVKEYIGNDLPQFGVFGNGEVDAEITWK